MSIKTHEHESTKILKEKNYLVLKDFNKQINFVNRIYKYPISYVLMYLPNPSFRIWH